MTRETTATCRDERLGCRHRILEAPGSEGVDPVAMHDSGVGGVAQTLERSRTRLHGRSAAVAHMRPPPAKRDIESQVLLTAMQNEYRLTGGR